MSLTRKKEMRPAWAIFPATSVHRPIMERSVSFLNGRYLFGHVAFSIVSKIFQLTVLSGQSHNFHFRPTNMSRCRQVVFTLNNYTPEQEDALATLVDRHPNDVQYVLFGHEVGENGTPHLQGLILFKNRFRFNQIHQKQMHVETIVCTNDT